MDNEALEMEAILLRHPDDKIVEKPAAVNLTYGKMEVYSAPSH